MKIRILTLPLLAAAVFVVAGCSSNAINSATTSGATGSAFVVGTDAPVASILSFNVQLESITATDANGNTVSLISGSPTIDFARFNGLQGLVDMNDVPAGTYKSVTITLNSTNGVLGFLNTSGTGAPTIQTEDATFTGASNGTVSVTETLANPLVVAQSGSPAGVRIDFDLRKSIAVDSNGNFTGVVNPTFNVSAVANSDPGGYIDDFIASVVSVDATAQTFVIQGPHGENFTVDVNGQTEWENSETINSLVAGSSIVEVSGALDHADQTFDADTVAILSQNGFYARGQVTYVTPPTGAATSFDLYVRGLLPASTGLTLGQLAQVNLTGNENFFIYNWHNPLTTFLFNSSALVAGQDVSIGGPASGAASASAVTVKRVVLRHWGFNGVASNINAGQGTFTLQVSGFAGVLIPTPVTVYVTNKTAFRLGFSTLSDVNASDNVRVVGLLLKNPANGQLVLLAHYVDLLD